MALENTNVSRRTLVKGAAWSLPVVAVAAATPLAAASTAVEGVEWTDSNTALLSLRLLDGTGVITAQALVTVPTEFTVTAGAAAISTPAAIKITVGRPSGINLPLGRARGFGVAAVGGTDTLSSERTVSYQSALGVEYGLPITTWTGARPLTVAANGSVQVPIEFGLAGQSDLLSISALATFPVTMDVTVNGNTYTKATTISVPVGAGIL